MRSSSMFFPVNGKERENRKGAKNRVEKKFWLKAMIRLECF
jgi:hypothetical protein